MEFVRSERRLIQFWYHITFIVSFASLVNVETMKAIRSQVLPNEVRKFENEMVQAVNLVTTESNDLFIPYVSV